MSSGDKKALVRWLGSDDDGKLEVVDASWIKNFDADVWKSLSPKDRPESEIIQYKKGKKPESGIYRIYDATIISVSSEYIACCILARKPWFSAFLHILKVSILS